MKKNLLILLALIFTISANSQRNVALTLKKYKNNTSAVSVTFDEKVNQYISNKDNDIKTKIEKIEIVAFNKDNKMSDNDQKSISKSLDADGYDMLINARSKEGKVKVYGMGQSDDALNSLYAEVNSDIGNIYVLMTGKIHFEELSKLDLDFNGSDIFKVLSGKKEEFDAKSKKTQGDN